MTVSWYSVELKWTQPGCVLTQTFSIQASLKRINVWSISINVTRGCKMNCIQLFAERWKREICFLEEQSATVCTVATDWLMNVALVRVSSAAFVFLELRERERDEKMIDYLFKHIKVDHSDFHLEIHQLSWWKPLWEPQVCDISEF